MASSAIEQARQLRLVIDLKKKQRDDCLAQARDHAQKALALKDSAQWWQERIDESTRMLDKLEKKTA